MHAPVFSSQIVAAQLKIVVMMWHTLLNALPKEACRLSFRFSERREYSNRPHDTLCSHASFISQCWLVSALDNRSRRNMFPLEEARSFLLRATLHRGAL